MAVRGSSWKWWCFLLAGLAVAALTVLEYRDIAQLEHDGGELYLNKFVALIYHVAGKNGVLAFGLILSALIILASLRLRTLALRREARGF